MAILKTPSGEIEVRLRKPPFDIGDPIYFDEYEELGLLDARKDKCTRYIIPEDGMCGIEVIVKKGFRYGLDHKGVEAQVFTGGADYHIGGHCFRKADTSRTLSVQTFLFKTFSKGVVDGLTRKAATLSLKELVSDESLSEETDVVGVLPKALGSVRIRVYKYTQSKLRTVKGPSWEKELRKYESKLASQAKKVDQESFNKDGITHALGLSGGSAAGKPEPPQKLQRRHKVVEEINFSFICRSRTFLENHSFEKAPISMECQPWSVLVDWQRANCFKILQAYDKENTLQQKITEAGAGADSKVVENELFETGEVPNRWRAWSHLRKREKELMFAVLQKRRRHFERAEYLSDGNGNSTSQHATPDARVEEIELPGELLAASREFHLSASDDLPTIKQESGSNSTTGFAANRHTEVIIIDDTPPGSPEHVEAPGRISSQVTIKEEPMEPLSLPMPAQKALKRKTSHKAEDIDPELAAMEEEDERLEEELLAAQRVAHLLRERNDQKRKIAALKEKKTAVPNPASLT